MDNYKWSWWMILTILLGIILGAITGSMPDKLNNLQEILLSSFWSIYLVNCVLCLYYGFKEEQETYRSRGL